jgi:acyl carrier protein
MSDNLLRVQEIFRDVLDDPDLVLTRASDSSSVHGWDSVAHVNLIWNIEREFSVNFTLGELQELKNMGDILDLLGHKTTE